MPEDARPPAGELSLSLGSFLRRDAWSLIAAAMATWAVELGTWGVALGVGMSPAGALLALSATATLWVALAAPGWACGGHGPLSALLRAGTVADASGVSLLVGWWLAREHGGPDLLAVAAVYGVLVSMTLAATALVLVPASRRWRPAWAAAAGCLLWVLLTTPLWVNGLLDVVAFERAVRWATLAKRVNPFFGVSAALGVFWENESLMYRVTVIGEDVPTDGLRWYDPAWRMAALAGLAGAIAAVRRWMAGPPGESSRGG
jgi:hypothetical protein